MDIHQQQLSSQPNSLIHEKSPYLLQHAYNPVNWYAWTDEAFTKARLEDKPIFLSIGYSTCHWCHVMAKESFENEAVAAILNASFIAVKVDREERPDIDQIYMIATQAMTGGGGWPMSVFLFADKKPFYAGTYFPPEPRHNHPGFPDLLNAIARAWTENKKALAESADRITAYLESSSTTEVRQRIKESWSDSGYAAFKEIYDTRFCGFGTGNKFPRPVSLDFLLHYAHRTGNSAARNIVEKTLSAMAAGGMYDHIGGGFHRYAVDRQWRIPHFEKMLYDQAQLCVTYLHMYQQTGNNAYAATAKETLDYVLRDMQHAEGGLYSAEDADSINPYDTGERGEGAYYLWKKNDIDRLLGAEDAKIFALCYGISDAGNALQDPTGEFTGRNILYQPHSLEASAAQLQLTTAEVHAVLDESKEKLLARRMLRTRPHLDDKVITAWNGLMISALSKAGQILESDRYLFQAQRVADFVLTNLFDHELKRRWRGGEARFEAVLEDYAFFIQGLLDLYSACHQCRYLKKALELSEKQIELFVDPAGGFFNSRASAGLLTRIKESYDGAEPSGNSVSAVNFLRLGRLLHKTEWIALATGTIRAFGRVFEENGSAMPQLLTALELYLLPQRLLIISGRKDADDTQEFLRQANRFFLPGLQVILADGGDNQTFLLPFIDILTTTAFQGGRAKAYLCTNHVCSLPISDAVELSVLLEKQAAGQPVIEDIHPGDQDKKC